MGHFAEYQGFNDSYFTTKNHVSHLSDVLKHFLIVLIHFGQGIVKCYSQQIKFRTIFKFKFSKSGRFTTINAKDHSLGLSSVYFEA